MIGCAVLARLRALVARDPPLVGAFLLLWAAALVPIWATRTLPLTDLPRHLATAALLHRYGNPAWGYGRFYTLDLLPLPYWGWLAPMYLLQFVLPVVSAGKLVLSAYALALPSGCALLARRAGRSPWLALFVFPLVFNLNLGYGFVAFLVGLAILPFAWVALDRFLDAPSGGKAAALAVASLALYFAHVLPWLCFGLAAAIQLACHGWRPRRLAAAAALMLPSVGLALVAFRAAARAGTAVHAGPLAFAASWPTTGERLRAISSQLVLVWPGDDRALQVLMLLGGLWLALLLTARTDGHDTAARAWGSPLRLEWIALSCALLALVLPGHLEKPVDLWMIGGRFVPVAAIFTLLLPHGPIAGRRKLLFLPVIALCVYYPLKLAGRWRDFDQRAAGALRLLRRVPAGKSTLTLIVGDGHDPAVDPQFVPFLAFHAYPQLLAGGYDPWAVDTGFPMRVKPGAALPAPHYRHPEEFAFDEHGRFYDYLLTRNEPSDTSLFRPAELGVATLVGSDSDWRLYEVRQ